jgi:hypothetical protein
LRHRSQISKACQKLAAVELPTDGCGKVAPGSLDVKVLSEENWVRHQHDLRAQTKRVAVIWFILGDIHSMRKLGIKTLMHTIAELRFDSEPC